MTCNIENSIEIIVLTDTFDAEDNFEQSVEQIRTIVIPDDNHFFELIELYKTMMM